MKKTILTNLICPNCLTVFPIQRRESKQKKVGHIKDLYCFKCKDIQKFVELKSGNKEDYIKKIKENGVDVEVKQTVSFTGRLVRSSEIRIVKNNTKMVNFVIAKNYTKFNEEETKWEDLGTIFVDCVVFGRTAENFIVSNIPNGTPLIVNGTLNAVKESSYLNKDGVEVKVPFKEQVIVDSLGVSFTGNIKVNVEKNEITNKEVEKKDNKKEEVKATDKTVSGMQPLDDDIFDNLF